MFPTVYRKYFIFPEVTLDSNSPHCSMKKKLNNKKTVARKEIFQKKNRHMFDIDVYNMCVHFCAFKGKI